MKAYRLYILLILLIILYACQKTSVYFRDNSLTDDPNITFWDNYKVALSTYKLDTFITSSDSVWVLGSVYDTEFGKITGTSFAEIGRPAGHPFKADNIVMDSAVLFLIPNGNYYGDTMQSYKLNIYQLSENLGTDTAINKTYYNINSTPHSNITIGSISTLVKPQKKDTLFIKLSDAFAQDFYNQMKNGTEVMNNQARFRSYLKGLCIEPDSMHNKAVYQFSATGSAAIIRYYYTEKGTYSMKKHYDITYLPAKQYNNVRFNYNGSTFSPFSPVKSSLIESSRLNDKAFLNSYVPSLAKIEFPDIVNIKQTYPFVKIMKAELEIRVKAGLNAYPYTIPPLLTMYISNQNNELSSVLVSDATGYSQTGDLVSNLLVPDKTKYTFNVTSYINTVLEEGDFSKKALFLSPYATSYNSTTSRLVLSTQSKDPDIRLKLYVLGL